MEKREKVEFILEQMRLCLAKKDHIRTQIISKKISVKFFENDKEQVIYIMIRKICVLTIFLPKFAKVFFAKFRKISDSRKLMLAKS